jgi:hypothetical protein
MIDNTKQQFIDYRLFLLKFLPEESFGAEIGVHLGDFSREIIDIVRPKKLFLIDPWQYESSSEYKQAWYGGLAKGKQHEIDQRYNHVKNLFTKEITAGQVTVLRKKSDIALAGLTNNSLDWVYIDGNHLYKFVATDLELSLAKVKPGGLITGDDYDEGGWWQGSVKRAVDDFIATGKVEVVLIKNRQYILKKLSASQS